MAPHTKCPHCGKEVRIDKGLLKPKGDLTNREWEADCPNCGGLISTNPKKPIMVEVKIKNKGQYLKENYPFSPVPKLNDTLQCLHCDKIFTVKDYKVFKDKNGDDFICCPNAPDCDGTVIDWVEKDF